MLIFFFQKTKKLEDDKKKTQIEVKINMQCTKHNTFDIILHCVFSKNAKHILHWDQKQVYHSILYHTHAISSGLQFTEQLPTKTISTYTCRYNCSH